MVTMLVYNRRQKELESICKLSKDLFAFLSEEELELYCFSSPVSMQDFMAENPLMDLACIGIMGQDEITLLQKMRRLYTKAEFLLVVDDVISPMKYLTPAIRAASLLLYPYEHNQQKQVLREFFASYIEKRYGKQEDGFLVIDNHNGMMAIPFQKIYYIEVRARKIFIRIQNKEYSKYESMEHILSQLPDYFIRCHRSFAFNAQHLERIVLSENAVYLEHGLMVPLSRSYKPAVREYMYASERKR